MMLHLFRLSLRQLAGRRRLALILALAALPVLLSWIIVGMGGDRDASEFVRAMLDGMVIAVVLPVVAIAVAPVAFGNELEDRTLGFLALKPVPRWQIVLPKALAAVLVAGPPVVLSGVLSTLIGLGADWQTASAAAAGLAAGVAAYSAIFVWTGLVTSRAIGFGLAYVLLWEGVLASFFSGIRFLSVRGYVVGVMQGIDAESFQALAPAAMGLPAALAGVAAVTAAFLGLTVYRLRTMDVP